MRAVERGRQLGGGLVALVGRHRERARQEGAKPRILDRVERRVQLVRAVPPAAGEQRHQDERGGEQVRAAIDAAVLQLLRRHVGRRAAHGLDGGAGHAQAREAEVDEHDPGLVADGRDERVRRLDVGMHEPDLVHRGEPGEQLAHELDRPRARHDAVALDQLLQIEPVEQLHRVEQAAVAGDVRLVDPHHVRVIDPPDASDLVHEQLPHVRGRIDGAIEHLDRDVAIDGELARPVDGAEAATGELALEPEPTR